MILRYRFHDIANDIIDNIISYEVYLKFDDIIENCMISYMILNMISNFYII
jgi:hypothetical protein